MRMGRSVPRTVIRSRRKPWPANCRSSRSVRSESIRQLSEKFPQTFKTTEFIPGILRAVTTRRARGPRRPPTTAGEDMQTLPVWKAFVVQFSRETNPRARTFSGACGAHELGPSRPLRLVARARGGPGKAALRARRAVRAARAPDVLEEADDEQGNREALRVARPRWACGRLAGHIDRARADAREGPTSS
jgi:hypothetical protein